MILQPNTPHSIDAEYALIGWLVTDQRTITTLAHLQADDFYSAPHADIFQAAERLIREGKQITPFTISPCLNNPAAFEDSGGVIKYISGAVSYTLAHPRPAELVYTIIDMAKQRRLIESCEKIINSPNMQDDLKTLEQSIEALRESGKKHELKTCTRITESILDDMANDVSPYSTGFSKLDECMGGGIFPKKSYGFAARKKVGKTALAASISYNLNQSGIKHLFICGEMSAKEIHQRVLSRHTSTFPSAFVSDYGKSMDFSRKIANAVNEIPANTLYADAPALTFDDLRRIVYNAVEVHGIKGFILDYWQLVGGKGNRQSTAEHLDEVAQWIADTSRRLGVFSITMAQINQEGNTRGGEGIRLAFDQIYQIHRPDLSLGYAWVEMMETRYTRWLNVGDEHNAGVFMDDKGPYYRQL